MIGQVEIQTPLGNFGTVDVEEGATIQDIYDMAHLEGKPVVCVLNGQPTLRASWNQVLTAEDEMHFIMIPQGGGDEGKSGLGRAIGLLVVAVASFYFGPQVGGLLGFTGNAAAAVGGAIITFSGALLVNAIFPPPTTATRSAEQANVSPTYNINAQGNSARFLQPIPRLYGRHLIFPDYAVEPWSSFDGISQQLRQVFCIGLGEYDVEQIRLDDTVIWNSSTGNTSILGSGLTVQVVEPGAVNLSSETYVNAQEVTNIELKTVADAGGPQGPFVVNRAGSIIDRIQCDISFPRGLYFNNATGQFVDHTVTFQFERREIDDLGNPIGSWTNFLITSRTGDSPQPFNLTLSADVPLGRYEVRAQLTSTPQEDVSYGETVNWITLRGRLNARNIYDDETTLFVLIQATDDVAQNYAGRLNVIATSKLLTHDGTDFSALTQATRNPAWIALDALRNDIYGGRVPDERIDIDAFVALAATADERGDTFNGVFDSRRSVWDVLVTILASMRAQPVIIGGVITVIRDEQASIPRAVFTPDNIIANSLETQYLLFSEDSPDSVIVEFFDEMTWSPNEVTCALPGSLQARPARIQAFGITSLAQAWRHGIYQAAVTAYRRIFTSLSTALEGKLLLRGDTVLVNHDIPNWGKSATADDWDAATRTLMISQPIPIDTAVMGVVDRRNKLWGTVNIESVSADGQTVVLDETSLNEAIAEFGAIPIFTDLGADPTRLTFGTLATHTERFKVIETTATSTEQFTVRLNNDDLRVYDADTGTPPSIGG